MASTGPACDCPKACWTRSAPRPLARLGGDEVFAQSTQALPRNPRLALSLCRSANVIGFSCASSMTVYGVALKLLGSSWLVPGILFAVSLGFLVLWRPRPLA
jgi:hypothetical protein